MSQNNNLFQPYTQGQWGVLWQIFVRGVLPTRRRSVASRWGGKNPPHKICHRTPIVPVCKHLSQYGVFTDHQHGFRAKRSTETQLICTIHDIASAIQSNKTIHAAILDFSKAFDKVPHRRLLKKLDYYGILHNWFDMPRPPRRGLGGLFDTKQRKEDSGKP